MLKTNYLRWFKLRNRTIIYLLFFAIGFIGCEENSEPPFYEANSCFTLSEDKAYVDSLIHFNNCSDSLNVSYLWDFGDGNTSTERAPSHKYKNYGNYTITLKTFVNNIQTDITNENIEVIIGEKYFDLLKITGGFDFAECIDSSIIIIGATLNNEDYKIFISKFDKNLNKVWLRYLDLDLNPSTGSVEKLADGNFILSGSFDNSDNNGHFSLSKIDSSGNVLWDKKYPQTNGYCRHATESMDGNIISIGTESYSHPSGNTVYRTTVLKVDENGNYLWKKSFYDDWLMEADNIVPLDDGYTFAASTSGSCLNCQDSLVVTKLDFDGTKVWQTTVEWNSYVNAGWPSTIASNNNFIIAQNAEYQEYIVFDLNGQLVQRGMSEIAGNRFICSTHNDNFIIGGGETYWGTIELTSLDQNGNMIWNKSYGHRNTTCFPARGYGSIAKPLLDGNILFLGLSYKECTDQNESSMLLVKINEEGEIQ